MKYTYKIWATVDLVKVEVDGCICANNPLGGCWCLDFGPTTRAACIYWRILVSSCFLWLECMLPYSEFAHLSCKCLCEVLFALEYLSWHFDSTGIYQYGAPISNRYMSTCHTLSSNAIADGFLCRWLCEGTQSASRRPAIVVQKRRRKICMGTFLLMFDCSFSFR